ncbi:MAG: hypothetical protein Q9224_006294, partial [Gallowayella concinna]
SSHASLRSTQQRDLDYVEGEARQRSSSDGLIDDIPTRKASNDSSDHPSKIISEGNHARLEQPQEAAHPDAATFSVKGPLSSRPNKYHGPSATWRDWTAAERQVAGSLDQLRAKDLSAHLYNFYCLKRRVDSTKEWQLETDPDTDDHRSSSRKRKAWLPVRTWTAWPMDAQLVPRESDEFPCEVDIGGETKMEKKKISSSELLSDLLVAHGCKKAKEKFQAREWEDSDADRADPPRKPEPTSQRRVRELAGDRCDSPQFEPVVMTDDERAKSILQPSINHVLYKLDALLMGLHHARNSYATSKNTSAGPRPTTEDEKSRGTKRKRKASATSTSRASSRRRRSSSANLIEDDSEAITDAAASHIKVKSGLGLRDWSDVLGIASMCGFPSEVVTKTATRCSKLFDEGMVFRTLHEGKNDYSEVRYLPDMISVADLQRFRRDEEEGFSPGKEEDSDDDDDDEDEDRVGGVHVDGFLQEIRKHKSWSRRSRSKKQRI